MPPFPHAVQGNPSIVSMLEADVLAAHRANDAVPGGLYYDQTNGIRYWGQPDGSMLSEKGGQPPVDQSGLGYTDFRFSGLTGLTLDVSPTLSVIHDPGMGLCVASSTPNWNQIVKFRGGFDHLRADGKTIDWIFQRRAR
mgnify:FL=1